MNRYAVAAIWIAAIAGPWSLVAWLVGLSLPAIAAVALFSGAIGLFVYRLCAVSAEADEGEQYDPHR